MRWGRGEELGDGVREAGEGAARPLVGTLALVLREQAAMEGSEQGRQGLTWTSQDSSGCTWTMAVRGGQNQAGRLGGCLHSPGPLPQGAAWEVQARGLSLDPESFSGITK